MANVGLYRSNRQNMIAGVMGGIAERFGWNANLLRIIFVMVSLMSAAFPGILVYLVLWLIMPKQQFQIDASGYQNSVRTVNQDSNPYR
ncbi:PspC domain-containing protein [Acinetobacter sp.]|uniref:PspC domain-containing protein n=1 Tax=Acinetobacter sp. TaxID=472 RepID=UPI00388F6EAF